MSRCVSTAHQDTVNVSLTLSSSHSAELDEIKFNQHKIIYIIHNGKNLFQKTAVLFCIEWLVVWFRFAKFFKTLVPHTVYVQYPNTYTPKLVIMVLPISHFQLISGRVKGLSLGKPIKVHINVHTSSEWLSNSYMIPKIYRAH